MGPDDCETGGRGTLWSRGLRWVIHRQTIKAWRTSIGREPKFAPFCAGSTSLLVFSQTSIELSIDRFSPVVLRFRWNIQQLLVNTTRFPVMATSKKTWVPPHGRVFSQCAPLQPTRDHFESLK